jgi:hypothetical protein
MAIVAAYMTIYQCKHAKDFCPTLFGGSHYFPILL